MMKYIRTCIVPWERLVAVNPETTELSRALDLEHLNGPECMRLDRSNSSFMDVVDSSMLIICTSEEGK